MDSIIDGKPAGDDRRSLTAQQRVNVNVNFPYGIVSTVCVMVQHCDLQWFILQIFIINLESNRRRGKDNKRQEKYKSYRFYIPFIHLVRCVLYHTATTACHVYREGYKDFTSNLNHSEFHCGLRDLGQTSVLKVVFPNFTCEIKTHKTQPSNAPFAI